MSISGSLANAFSGLTAAARGAEVVSQNLANVMTDGYGRRELLLSSRNLGGAGGGVRVEGIGRAVNQGVISDRRLADAAEARDTKVRDFYAKMETAMGLPGAPGSLSTRIEQFEAALVSAASRPDADPRLDQLRYTAEALAQQFRTVSQSVQDERMAADAEIAREVNLLNTSLGRIVELNRDIRLAVTSGRDASGLLDERQNLIDRVSGIVPVREVPRDQGMVALFTTGGAILVDGLQGEVGFAPAATITADMTLASGALSGLTLRGLPATATARGGMLGGGSLGALMSLRDEIAPAAQARVDALARDLIERFESPAADPTLTPGAPGLFTDGGAALDPLDEIGLAGRLRLNTLVDPAQGGALWRLRDGLGATAPGPVGQAAGLNALIDALTALRPPSSGSFSGGARNMAGLSAEVLSGFGVSRQAAEAELSYSVARRDSLKAAELADGVDSDQELQRLLIVEQAYAANARVVSAAEAMLDRLMEI